MELFEEIRRDHDREGLSIRELARRHGVHRRAVRQALASALPPPRKPPEGRPAPKLGPYRQLIDGWLVADRKAPLKQRHTAKRIHERLVTEHGAEVAETTVRDYVRKTKRSLGLDLDGTVPQAHPPAAEAEVDWGEAKVVIAGKLTAVNLFVMRLSHSGASWVGAFERQNQLAFLEGHAKAIEFLGGTPARVRYDNLKAAVTKILRGRRRIEADRFVSMRSHYLFESFFCEPGEQGAHEKGGVEGEVGRFRRNHLVPVPEVESIAELNELIAVACEADLARRIRGREGTVGEMLAAERPLLRRPAEPFDFRERSSVRVDSKALATVRQNRYSVPAGLIGLRVDALIGASEIELVHRGQLVGSHPRSWTRHEVFAQLAHYAPLLQTKPGALAGSLALAQERDRGAWPACFDELWAEIAARTSPSEAAGQMVEVIMLATELGAAAVQSAVGGALAAGAYDGGAVALLARGLERADAEPLTDLGSLARAAAPEPDLCDYDQLLGAAS